MDRFVAMVRCFGVSIGFVGYYLYFLFFSRYTGSSLA